MAEGEGGGVPEPPLVKCIKPDSSHLFKAGKLLTLSIITSKGKVHFDKSSFPYFLLLLFYFIFVIVIIQLPFFFPFFFFGGGGCINSYLVYTQAEIQEVGDWKIDYDHQLNYS